MEHPKSSSYATWDSPLQGEGVKYSRGEDHRVCEECFFSERTVQVLQLDVSTNLQRRLLQVAACTRDTQQLAH